MFNNAIQTTPLTGDIANRLFANITALNMPDQSFLATLRALLRKRLPQNEVVQFTCRELHFSGNDVSYATTSENMNRLIPNEILYTNSSEHNIMILHTAYKDAGEKMLEFVRANTGTGKRHMGNYNRREDLRVFYARKINALFYTDDTQRNTVIFADQLNLKQFHTLQMMIPKYLPNLFANAPLTETETALLKSTGSKSAVEYETLIEEFAKDIDIRTEIIRSKLTGFETIFERSRMEEIKGNISACQRDYENYLSMLQDMTWKIQDYQYTLAGLECAISTQTGDSELMEYFICNKNLSLIQVAGSRMEFVAHGYADIYDPDAFEQYVGNHNGYMYSGINSIVSAIQMEKLYRAIFSEGRYKLRICAAYSADMQNGLKAFAHYVFPPESKTYLPNPHIQTYGCIGTYAGRFQEYMLKRDYVGAIDQAVVSARNLNFYDSAAIGQFAKNLSCSTIKCVEKPDGTLLTPGEVITELEGGTVCQDQ